MKANITLCKVFDLPDPGALGLTMKAGTRDLDVLLIRKGGEIYGYRNHCPHLGVNLNWLPDQFLDVSESFIQCATHGALFRIEDGYCVRGPCAGDRLRRIELRVEGEEVVFYGEGSV